MNVPAISVANVEAVAGFADGIAAGIAARLAQAVEPWRIVYADSVVLNTAVVFVHLSALLVAGGLAIAADRATLRIRAEQAERQDSQLGELAALHRPVLGALAVAFASGLLLLASDLESFLAMPALQVKIVLIVLLLLNGAAMSRRERSVAATTVETHPVHRARGWQRLRAHAVASIVLWLATVLSGTALSVS